MRTFLPVAAVLLGVPYILAAQSAALYQGVVNSQTPDYYFNFDNSLSSIGSSPSVSMSAAGGAYANDYFGNPSSSRSFSASTDSLSTSTDLIPGGGPTGGNTSANGVGTVSMLFRTLDSTTLGGQRFVFAQGNTTANANAFSLFFENSSNTDPGALKLRVGNGPTTTILPAASILTDTWYYFALSYDETRDSGEVIYYLGQAGGALGTGAVNISNISVVGDNGTVTLGNTAVGGTSAFRNPGSGQIDEFAVWSRELSATEIGSQFSALAVPEPTVFSLAALGVGSLLLRRRK